MPQDRIGWSNGIVSEAGESQIVFDPTSGRPLGQDWHVFVTHAHADHTYGFGTHARKYSTDATRKIFEALREREVRNCQSLKIGDTIRIDDSSITVLNSGHMMGACQFELVTPNFMAIYTGDINCVDTLTTKAAEKKPCDYLIVEATYGHPSYVFPPRRTLYADLVRWAMTEIEKGRIPTFQSYSSGKPQEIVRLFNIYTKIPVVCSPIISRANQVHNENGLKLDYLDSSASDGKRRLKTGECVYVTGTRSDTLPRNASRAVATGWAIRQAFRNCASFPLSSHADFNQLIQFVSSVRPKQVYVFTGYADILSAEIERRLGIRASPLPILAQTKLFDFYRKVTSR